ncbi:hypothetical protein ASF61_21645 [Duganella sp. Leaf126]|uniref:DUF1176 domain-containing protein n=1 Tax=Duganella sp. Leaf126 TaxID=1736266 RepID=UPI000700554F|nr:DUF1176 domain-containing protein [Duganella sp. Leaf126]KQQ44485.1 hypothetical protein ASF61_21645 [Duganella sp. Leaf126]
MTFLHGLRSGVLGAAIVAASAHAEHFTFKDWEVACDNTRRCEAVGYQKEEAAEPVLLALTRAAGAMAPVEAVFSPYTDDDIKLGALTVRVGRTTMRGLHADVALTPEQVGKLLPLLLNAESAKVSDGKRVWVLSLAGVKAALLKLDDLQGRVGTPTALAMRGNKPADAALAPLPAPQVQLLPAVATRAGDARLLPAIVQGLPHGGCESASDIADSERQNELHRLSSGQVLLVLECNRGAYQSSFELWTANDKAPYAAKRVRLPDAGGQQEAYVMNPAFDHGTLSSFSKGRGIADCNASASWGWTAAGFQLIEASSGQLCRGMPGGYSLREYTATVVRARAR